MISIVIPIYNREDKIVETLNSIKNQTFTEWECIIIDDGSNDNTVSVIAQFTLEDSRFKFYNRPLSKVKGPSSCRNYGFSQANGEYIQFFDSDDIMHPQHLEEKFKKIASNDFVVCSLKEFIGPFKPEFFNQKEKSNLTYSPTIFEDFVTGEFPMMMVAPMWKKTFLLPYMPIREDMHILEDHEFHARILSNEVSYCVVNRELIFYRVASTSSTNDFFNNIESGLSSYLKAKKTVLSIDSSNRIKVAILKMTLGIFRLGLAQRNFNASENILIFIRNEKLDCSLILKFKIIRISIVFQLIKFFGRGDTFLKPMLKL